MRRFCAVLTTAVLAFAGLMVASPAQAYPDVECHITDPGEACEGEPLHLTATVSPAVDCTNISITWNGMTRSGTGSSLTATFPTRKGDSDRPALRRDLVSCTYTDASANGTVPRTVSAPGTVIIKECGDNDDSDDSDDSDSDEDDDNGGLPNTGGERLAWLIIGLLLVVAGTTVVVSSRKPDESA